MTDSAVVTGAASGIGRAVAVELAKARYRIAAFDTNLQGLAETEREIQALGATCDSIQLDICQPDAVRSAVAAMVGRHANLKALVHCAGIAARKSLTETTREDWDRVVAVNLSGTFNVIQAIVPALKAGGAIVAISSIAARTSYGFPAYSASKGGVTALVRELAAELAPSGIRINAISPGLISTPLTDSILGSAALRDELLKHSPLGRLGKPEDIATAAAFLVSDGAAFITGIDLVVDGGMSSSINWGPLARQMTHKALPR